MRFRNYINRYNKKNRIYSMEELLAMTLNDLLDNEQSIMSQDSDIGIPSYEELRQSPNTRWIDSYTDNNGKKMGGFYGSVLDNVYLPFADNFSFEPINKIKSNTRPILMSEADSEEDEEPTVLEGGVEENVYLPEEQEEQNPKDENNVWFPEIPEEDDERIPDLSGDDINIPSKKIPEIDDSAIYKVFADLLSKKNNTKNEDTLISNERDSFEGSNEVFNNNTYQYETKLPDLQQNQYTEELKQLYEKLLEELRKRMRTMFSSNIRNGYNTIDNFNLNTSPWNSPYLPKASNEDYKLKNELIRFNNEQNKNYKDAKDLMNIALIGPDNIQSNSEYNRIDKNDINSLSKEIGYKLDNKFTTIKFEPNSSLATSINSSPSLMQSINSWCKKTKNERGQTISVTINDNENLFRSINNATILNPKFENGVFTGYLYDKYDFKPDEFKDKYTTAINTGAVSLQTVGMLKNYNILVPIKMDLK